ncbi:MAG: aminotransferase class III-fold pyridoxal phosphate-dependent enzyme [Acidimicrobiia bacterium]|nr:aminotransferase class III-fold pyridoxal phosphate-dependent enzyme [Acidimicrobiia bacterium]
MDRPATPFGSRAATMQAFADHVSRGKVEAFEALGLDIVLGRREGPFFWDAFDDRRFFNCHCNGGIFNLGHRNPAVLAALRTALDRDEIDVGNHHLVSGWKAELAARLAATTGGRCPGVVLSPSGSEAVEVALKTAYAVTKRTEVVSVHGAYHGHTALAAMAADARYHEPFRLALPGFVHVPHDDLGAMDGAIGDDTAAVILETIPATLGMRVPSDDYLSGVQALCRDRGALFVLDEIQTGLGRSGRMWCYEHDEVEPDVVVTGKGLGGGVYPIAATIMTPEVHRFYDDEPFVHVSSYGGSDLGCAVAMTVLDLVEAPGFFERVEEVGLRLEKELAVLPCEIRRRGLFMGLRWPDEDAGILAAKACIDGGVFAVFANNDTSVMQFLPPLVLTDGEVEELADAVVRSLS